MSTPHPELAAEILGVAVQQNKTVCVFERQDRDDDPIQLERVIEMQTFILHNLVHKKILEPQMTMMTCQLAGKTSNMR